MNSWKCGFFVLHYVEYLIFWFYFCSIEDDDSSSSSEDESSSDDSSSESEDEGIKFCNGAKANPAKLNVVKANDRYEIVYDGDKRVYVQTGKFCGDIQTYTGKFSPSILIKNSAIMNDLREIIEKKLGKKAKLNFYGKPESDCFSVFTKSLKCNGKSVINVVNRGREEQIALDSLEELSPCIMDGFLISDYITKAKKNHYMWKLSLVSMRTEEAPTDYVTGYSAHKKFGKFYK